MFLIKILFRFFFFCLLIAVGYYIVMVESEKYESSSIIMVKDLSKESSPSALGSLLLSGSSNEMKDAKLLEVYINSYAMYQKLDRDFNLSGYYASSAIDPLDRLYNETKVSWFKNTQENLLEKYQAHTHVMYDEPSTTLKISFAHTNAQVAKEVVEHIVRYAGETLNLFEKQNTKIVLKFLEKQEKKKYEAFILSSKKLLNYQNKHHTLDPKIDIESKSTILASLEAELVQKEVAYNSKLQYLNALSPEMKLAKGNIKYIRKSISKIKRQITGVKGKQELNVDLSDFTLLQSEVEFNKELYRQVLAKLEETKFSIQQNSKNLIVVTPASMADSYRYPNKIKEILTIYIIIFFLYGIISLIITLIAEHKD